MLEKQFNGEFELMGSFDGEGEPEYVTLMMGGKGGYVQANGAYARYPDGAFGTGWSGNNPSQNVVRFNDGSCFYGTVLHYEDATSVMLNLGYENFGVHKVVVDRIILKHQQSFEADLGDGRRVSISAWYSAEDRNFFVYVYPRGFPETAS